MKLAFAALLLLACAAPAGADDGAATNAVATAADGASATNAAPVRMARITSDVTHYDRKEGLAVFTGHVHVDDEQYQMHADKAYVFLEGTNALKRIVAIGHVALTNGLRVATGEKASYYKASGMVVLSGGKEQCAEIVDASRGQKQSLRGSKIKFWTGSEQVEVIDATIVAPASRVGGLDGIGK